MNRNLVVAGVALLAVVGGAAAVRAYRSGNLGPILETVAEEV